MHVRSRGLIRVVLVTATAVLALCAGNAKAWNSGYAVPADSTFGVTTCPQLSGPMFIQQGDFCFYFPDGSTNTPATCDPTFCGSDKFLLTTAGTFTATLTYPSPSGFNALGLQLCHDGQVVGDPANCPTVMSTNGAPVTCDMEVLPANDNGTPFDTSDDIGTTTITCVIPAGDSINPYTLIVYPLSVLHCDIADLGCMPDFTQGITAALSGSFSSTITPPGPVGAKVEGGGELAPQQHFSLNAMNDPSKWSKAHIRFGITSHDPTRCMFAADGANFVDVEPNMLGDGGHALIQGFGTVTDANKIKHPVSYQLQVTDGGKGGTDTFQLSAAGCDTGGLPLPVTHGNIHIEQKHADDH